MYYSKLLLFSFEGHKIIGIGLLSVKDSMTLFSMNICKPLKIINVVEIPHKYSLNFVNLSIISIWIFSKFYQQYCWKFHKKSS